MVVVGFLLGLCVLQIQRLLVGLGVGLRLGLPLGLGFVNVDTSVGVCDGTSDGDSVGSCVGSGKVGDDISGINTFAFQSVEDKSSIIIIANDA